MDPQQDFVDEEMSVERRGVRRQYRRERGRVIERERARVKRVRGIIG